MSITANDFIQLKNLVKSEMARRDKSNVSSQYGSDNYDYITVPQTNGSILLEHIEKIDTPLRAVAGSSALFSPSPNQHSVIRDLQEYRNLVASLAQNSYTSASGNGGCTDGACTGLCTNSCTSCTSCTGTCLGSCSANCSNDCSGSCRVDCGNDCYNYCETGCWKSCAGDCTHGINNHQYLG